LFFIRFLKKAQNTKNKSKNKEITVETEFEKLNATTIVFSRNPRNRNLVIEIEEIEFEIEEFEKHAWKSQ
jgi:hypothetical protein